MTSTLYVDNLVEKTSGNGVHIPGHVIQVQYGTLAGSSSMVTGQVNYLNTGLSVSITPKFDNSKFLVMASQIIGIGPASANSAARYDLRIREVNISSGTNIWKGMYVGTDNQGSGNLSVVSGIHGYYTASSTNALTFNTQIREAGGSDGAAGSMYFNWYAGGLATITAMEIAQ
jgi:hypothetical protein